MTQMHAYAFRFSVNPLPHLSGLARLRSLARPAGPGLLLAARVRFRFIAGWLYGAAELGRFASGLVVVELTAMI